MDGGWIVRERGGAEIGCTVDTGMVVVARSKDTDLVVAVEPAMVVSEGGSDATDMKSGGGRNTEIIQVQLFHIRGEDYLVSVSSH